MPLTIADLEQLQTQHPDWQMELVDGSIVVMRPSDYESDEIGSEFLSQLRNWVRPSKLGRVTGAAAGFILPKSEEEESSSENGSNGHHEPMPTKSEVIF
jgi:Uma2 family endonuclease